MKPTQIKLGDHEYEFKFNFARLAELQSKGKVELSELSEFAAKFENIPLVCSIGIGGKLTESEITELLNTGNFNTVKQIINAFSSEVVQYFAGEEVPNESNISSESDTVG